MQSKYPDTLVCPCEQILNESYSTFIISFIAKFNPLCSRDFVSEQWLNYVNYRLLPQLEYHYIGDFHHPVHSFFQMLRTLCTLVSQTMNDRLIEFYSTTVLTNNPLSAETFLAIILPSKDHFLKMTASSIQTSLNSLRTIVQRNGIVNRLETNFLLQILYYNGEQFSLVHPFSYPPDGCSCDATSYCHTTTDIYRVLRKSN